MKAKKTVWYEVIYTKGGYQHQVLSRGKREAKELHKHYPGSTFRIIS